MFASLARGASLWLGTPSLWCGVPLAHEELKPKVWQWDMESSFYALREHEELKPKGLPHHSEGMPSLSEASLERVVEPSEPTLERVDHKGTFHRTNPNGVPHL
jgi:hypothetical protein